MSELTVRQAFLQLPPSLQREVSSWLWEYPWRDIREWEEEITIGERRFRGLSPWTPISDLVHREFGLHWIYRTPETVSFQFYEYEWHDRQCYPNRWKVSERDVHWEDMLAMDISIHGINDIQVRRLDILAGDLGSSQYPENEFTISVRPVLPTELQYAEAELDYEVVRWGGWRLRDGVQLHEADPPHRPLPLNYMVHPDTGYNYPWWIDEERLTFKMLEDERESLKRYRPPTPPATPSDEEAGPEWASTDEEDKKPAAKVAKVESSKDDDGFNELFGSDED